MRYYVKRASMQTMLENIMKKKDQQTLEVFKSVLVYHSPCTTKESREVRKAVSQMLFMPKMMVMALTNIILCILTLPFVLKGIHFSGISLPSTLLMGILYALIAFDLFRLYQAFHHLSVFYPYVLVDELIARKVITLMPKTQNAASKKNAKAKVVD